MTISMSDGPAKPRDKRRKPDDSYGQVAQPGTFRIERLLPGPIERVWSYVTEPEKRRKWFGSGPMELRAGGQVKLQFKFAELSAEKTPPTKAGECEVPGQVIRCDPPRLLSYTWGSAPDASEVTFELTPRGKDVLLVITHRRLGDRGTMISVASGWHTHLGILTDLFNGVDPRPFWATKTWMEEQYLERFEALGADTFLYLEHRGDA
jgi:uncharacterized protein YndB with AHSA1/START domain